MCGAASGRELARSDARSSASGQAPREPLERLRDQMIRPASFVAAGGRFASDSLEHSRARSSSPRRIRSRQCKTRGLSMNSSASPRRSSISAPRSSRPGVISAAHVSAWPLARSRRRANGSPTRSAFPSAARRPTSAAHVGREQVDPGSEGPGSAPSGRRRPPPRRALRRRARSSSRVGPERHGERNEDVRPLHAGRNLREELLEQRGRPLAVTRETVEVCRPQAPLSRRGGSSGVSSAASSESSAAAAVAPRAAACSAAASSSAATAASGPSAASARWRACSSSR